MRIFVQDQEARNMLPHAGLIFRALDFLDNYEIARKGQSVRFPYITPPLEKKLHSSIIQISYRIFRPPPVGRRRYRSVCRQQTRKHLLLSSE